MEIFQTVLGGDESPKKKIKIVLIPNDGSWLDSSFEFELVGLTYQITEGCIDDQSTWHSLSPDLQNVNATLYRQDFYNAINLTHADEACESVWQLDKHSNVKTIKDFIQVFNNASKYFEIITGGWNSSDSGSPIGVSMTNLNQAIQSNGKCMLYKLMDISEYDDITEGYIETAVPSVNPAQYDVILKGVFECQEGLHCTVYSHKDPNLAKQDTIVEIQKVYGLDDMIEIAAAWIDF